MSKTRKALNLPIYQPKGWGRPSNNTPLRAPWFGLDTERDAKNGDFVCGRIWNPKGAGEFQVIPDLPTGTYWVWNLGYDIEGMVRDLDIDEGWAMRADGAGWEMNGAKCRYYHGKRFEWRDENGPKIFLEASSFFNRIRLAEAAKILCSCKCANCKGHKKLKTEHCGGADCPSKMGGVDASKMSKSRYQKDQEYREIVNRYCTQDAKIAYQLIAMLGDGLRQQGIEIGSTPGATARRFISRLPPFPKVIWTTQRYFLQAYCGGRFEIVKRGYFERASQFDIVSAYPWALARCPLLTESAFQKFSTRMSDGALYGAYLVDFKCADYLGIAPQWKGSTRVFSAAEKGVWVCKPELDLIREWGGEYIVKQAVEIFDENATDGWRELIEPQFEMRKKHKQEPIGHGAKVVMNSSYGGLIQLVPKGGQWVPIAEAKNPVDFAGTLALEGGPPAFEGGRFYAPCYASNLTSLVRRKVLETCADLKPENVIGAHTDSILCINGRPKLSAEMGGWEEVTTEPTELIVLKSGQYSLGDKVKGRGIHRATKEVLWAPTHNRQYRVSVKTADKWSDVSLIRNKEVANNIGWELKRVWERELKAKHVLNKEWVDSRPLVNVGRKA